MFDIPQELKKLPHKPGVYIMRNENGQVIYVGKAVDLHNRVRNYFQESSAQNAKTYTLVKNISTFEYLITDNELEALILENNLIKLHMPRFNIRLKDDKSYPYIKITNERLPRIMFTRKRGKDKSKYFGPYVSAFRVHEIIELIHKIWPIRNCQRIFPRDFGKGRPCLNFHIGQCKAPCNHTITEAEYNNFVAEVERFIQGKIDEVLQKLTVEMNTASADMQFERAAELRDLISAVRTLAEHQKADTCDGDDRDVLGLAREKDEALIQVFFIREGKMTGREHLMMQGVEGLPDGEIFSAFIKQFYGEAAFIPKELALPTEPSDRAAIMEWLAQVKGGRNVAINIPQRGDKRRMVELAQKNAELTMEQFGVHIKREAEKNNKALGEIAEALGMAEPPARIEAYDISNIQGFESVGSMVAFENGQAKNSDYRKFKIKGVLGPDDYASMDEVITRRFTRYLQEREEPGKFSKLPDLLMIDGGKGQISAAEKALAKLSLSLPVCGMVKDDRHRTRGLMYNDVEIEMSKHSEGFKLVTRIQDEVHRFAVEYHRKLRADAQVHSILDEIKGVGPTRRKALMRHFKNVEAIRDAAQEELAAVDAMNAKSAEAVYNYFHS